MRGARLAALGLVLPLAGCVFAVDQGGKKSLEKRIQKLEKRVKELESRPSDRLPGTHKNEMWEQ